MSHKLTQKQLKAVYLLARGMTTIEIGRQLKLRRETLSRWKQLPEFHEKFQKVMDEARAGMQDRLTALVDASIARVQTELDSYYGDPKRVQTALNVLKLLGIERAVLPNGSEKAEK